MHAVDESIRCQRAIVQQQQHSQLVAAGDVPHINSRLIGDFMCTACAIFHEAPSTVAEC